MRNGDGYALDDAVMRRLVDWSTAVLADGRIAVTLELESHDGAAEQRQVICHRVEAEYLGLALREAAWALIPAPAKAADATQRKNGRGRPKKTRDAAPPNGQAIGAIPLPPDDQAGSRTGG